MIAVIADTHMPKGKRRLPVACYEQLVAAAAVIHAGGFQIFNPGSPTERRRAPRPSMGLLHPTATGLRFEHFWLG